jgi:hypothetical protein
MGFARLAVSAVDQDCSSNDMRRVCDHQRPYQPPKRNSQLEVARLQNSARPYHDWNKHIPAEWYAPNAAFRVRVARGCLTALTAASEKFGMKLA